MSRRALHLDVESRSTVDLLKAGAFAYWEHANTDTICAAFCVDDEPMQSWVQGDPVPDLIIRAAEENWLVYAHNAQFESLCVKHSLHPKYGWPLFDPEQYRCTAAYAAAMALPRALGNAAAALDMEVQKDAEGRRLMLMLCRPRRVEGGVITWWDDPAKTARLVKYCMTDVEVERGLTKRLRPLIPEEQELWVLDQKMNARGVRIDVPNIKRAQKAIADATEAANKELAKLTKHRVTAVTQNSVLAEWLAEQGVDLEVEDKAAKAKLEAAQEAAAVNDPDFRFEPVPTQYRLSVAKKQVKDALAVAEKDSVIERVLQIRQSTAKSSTAKLTSFLARVSDDGRVRENLMYHGASTGRWSGKGVQLQNVPRGSLKYEDVVGAIDCLKAKSPLDWLSLYGEPVDVISSCLRGFIIPDPGNELLTADYSNIEGRVIAWLADERWKMQAFRDFDAGIGPDLYLIAAAKIFNLDVADLNKKSPQRQPGKIAELACNYGGGIGAFQAMAAQPQNNLIISDEEADEIKIAWRAEHPQTVRLWAELEDACIEAVNRPNNVVRAGDIQRGDLPSRAGKVAFLSRKGVLWMQLPSGRRLAYIQPFIKDRKTPWGAVKPQVHFMGVHPKTKQWDVQHTYGGSLAENATQAVARDVMRGAMLRMDARGWDLILTVHDEVIAEAHIGAITKAEFEAEMIKPLSWCMELPLAAEGDITQRYRK